MHTQCMYKNACTSLDWDEQWCGDYTSLLDPDPEEFLSTQSLLNTDLELPKLFSTIVWQLSNRSTSISPVETSMENEVGQFGPIVTVLDVTAVQKAGVPANSKKNTSYSLNAHSIVL